MKSNDENVTGKMIQHDKTDMSGVFEPITRFFYLVSHEVVKHPHIIAVSFIPLGLFILVYAIPIYKKYMEMAGKYTRSHIILFSIGLILFITIVAIGILLMIVKIFQIIADEISLIFCSIQERMAYKNSFDRLLN